MANAAVAAEAAKNVTLFVKRPTSIIKMMQYQRVLFWLLSTGCVALTVYLFLQWNVGYIANDGVQYLSTASNWLAGKGFSTSSLLYAPHFQHDFPAPQTVWPIGYPWLIAALAGTGLGVNNAALVINLLCHILSAVFSFLILRRMQVSVVFAATSAMLFYLTTIPWYYMLGITAEALFTAITLAVILCLPTLKKNELLRWGVCGLLLAAAVSVRYSGMLFVFGVVSVLVIFTLGEFVRQKSWNILLRWIVIAVPAAIVYAGLSVRTLNLVGSLQRRTGTDEPLSVYATFKLWVGYSADLVGLSPGALYAHIPGLIVFMILFCVVVLVSVHSLKYFMSLEVDHESEKYSRLVGCTVLLNSIVFVVYFTYCSLTDSVPSLTTRYCYQIFPGLFLLFCFHLFVFTHRCRITFISPKLQKSLPLVLAALFLSAQISEAMTPARFTSDTRATKAAMSIKIDSVKNSDLTLQSFIDKCFVDTNDYSIWSTHGQNVHIFTQVPTWTLAHKYARDPADFSELQARIQQYRPKLFVFINEPHKKSGVYHSAMAQMKSWLVKNGHHPIPIENNSIGEHSSVNVFAIDNQCRDLL